MAQKIWIACYKAAGTYLSFFAVLEHEIGDDDDGLADQHSGHDPRGGARHVRTRERGSPTLLKIGSNG